MHNMALQYGKLDVDLAPFKRLLLEEKPLFPKGQLQVVQLGHLRPRPISELTKQDMADSAVHFA